MSYLSDFVHETSEMNRNNNHQWENLIETVCQGDIRNYLYSSFWDEYQTAASAFDCAIEALDEEVSKIVSQLPCD